MLGAIAALTSSCILKFEVNAENTPTNTLKSNAHGMFYSGPCTDYSFIPYAQDAVYYKKNVSRTYPNGSGLTSVYISGLMKDYNLNPDKAVVEIVDDTATLTLHSLGKCNKTIVMTVWENTYSSNGVQIGETVKVPCEFKFRESTTVKFKLPKAIMENKNLFMPYIFVFDIL